MSDDTLAADLARAKKILERGRPDVSPFELIAQEDTARIREVMGGTIFGGDNYAAYKLLERFVAKIERLLAEVEDLHEEIQLLTGEVHLVTGERDEAIAKLPTDIPFDSQGHLLLNAYGRLCYEAGRLDAATDHE